MTDLLWLALAFLGGLWLGAAVGWTVCGLLLNATRAADAARTRADEYARFRAWYHARDQRAED